MIKTFEDIRQARLRGAKVVDKDGDEWGWDLIENRPCYRQRKDGRVVSAALDGEDSAFWRYWSAHLRVVEPVSELKSECVPDPLPLPAAPKVLNLLNATSAERKTMPVYTGAVMYFPDALAGVAHVSFKSNEKHNPGMPMHWSFGKSADHPDAELRHAIEKDRLDPEDGLPEVFKKAWRALADAQEWAEKQDPALHTHRQAQRDRQAKGEL